MDYISGLSSLFHWGQSQNRRNIGIIGWFILLACLLGLHDSIGDRQEHRRRLIALSDASFQILERLIPMSITDLINLLSRYPMHMFAVFGFLPIFSLAYGKIHPRGSSIDFPHKYIYSILVYLSCVPGIFSSVILAYGLFFLRSNLLEANLIIYFLPIASMVLTIAIIRRNVELDYLPGSDRLVGLAALLALTFVFALLTMKTRIWILFGGSLTSLLVIMAFLFFLLKWSAHKLFRGRTEPRTKGPRFPKF
jgi:hypothetical protein